MTSRLSTLEGQYEILGRIHEGGMGAIYKVRHRLLDQVRVVKVMHPQMADDESQRERFLREAQIAVRLRHPNVAHLYDFKIDSDGTAYIVMELIAGLNLHELLMLLGPQDAGVVAQLGCQALAAIGQLHQGHLVHRDVSPDNLVITVGSDGEPTVKLIDFGIAKSLDSRIALTDAGVFIGKVVYASPEHFGGPRGDSTVEPRSDLYSLAVVLYEALTGVSPINGKDTTAIIASHLFSAPKAFSESDPRGAVPEAVREIILSALEKDPERRPRDAESFGDALRDVAKREIEASREPGGSWERLRAALEATEERSATARPGSTQHRLDALFPPSGELALKERRDGDEPSNDELADQLLAEARRLLAGGQPDQALTRVRQVLALGSRRTEALQIRTEVEQAHAELTARLRALREGTGVTRKPEPAIETAPPPEEAAPPPEETMPRPSGKSETPPEPSLEEEGRIHAGHEALVAEARRHLEAGDSSAAEQAIQHAREQGVSLGDVLTLERDLELMTVAEPSPKRASAGLWAAGILVLLAAGVGAVLYWQPFATQPPEPGSGIVGATGMLRLDALPWVELVEIVDSKEQPVQVSADTYTPVALELPPGTYTLTVSHPRLAQPRKLEVAVRSGETVIETLEVAKYSADQYFEVSW